MKDGASFQEHLNYFNFLINKLMVLDVKIGNEKNVSLLLHCMLDSWNNLIINFIYVKSLDMKSIIVLLLTKELWCKLSQSLSTDIMVT